MTREKEHASNREWIGVDLDGTLAHYDEWWGHLHIGAPIAPMVQRVKKWLSRGQDVRIVTARVGPGNELAVDEIVNAIQDWTEEHIGARLPVTCSKDFNMVELWDDRCVAVASNTGQILGGASSAPLTIGQPCHHEPISGGPAVDDETHLMLSSEVTSCGLDVNEDWVIDHQPESITCAKCLGYIKYQRLANKLEKGQ